MCREDDIVLQHFDVGVKLLVVFLAVYLVSKLACISSGACSESFSILGSERQSCIGQGASQ